MTNHRSSKKLDVISGEKFNKLYPTYSENLYKLTNEEEVHLGFEYKTGLNEDIHQFDPNGSKGGLHCCLFESICEWIEYMDMRMHYYRKVTVPDDAIVVIYNDKFKVSKMILSDRKHIWSDYKICKMILMEHGSYLEHVDPQIIDEKLCWIALDEDKWSFKYIPPDVQTYDMLFSVVQVYGSLLEFGRKELQTAKLCKTAVGVQRDARRFIRYDLRRKVSL